MGADDTKFSLDNAHTRYFIVHMHRLLDPKAAAKPVSC